MNETFVQTNFLNVLICIPSGRFISSSCLNLDAANRTASSCSFESFPSLQGKFPGTKNMSSLLGLGGCTTLSGVDSTNTHPLGLSSEFNTPSSGVYVTKSSFGLVLKISPILLDVYLHSCSSKSSPKSESKLNVVISIFVLKNQTLSSEKLVFKNDPNFPNSSV